MYKLFALHLETSNQRAAVKVHSGDALEWHSEAGACLSSHFWTFSSSCFGHCASRSCHLTFKSPSESSEFLQQISLVSFGNACIGVRWHHIGVLKQDLTRRCWCLRRWRGRCLVQHPKRVLIVPEAEILVWSYGIGWGWGRGFLKVWLSFTSRPALAREASSVGGGRDKEGGPLHSSIDKIDSGEGYVND